MAKAFRIWLSGLVVLTAASVGAAEEDAATGLAVAPGWDSVRTHCGACHSYRLVTSQRGDEAFWRDIIRSMQGTQNLWPIAAEEEARIVGYLAANYAETDWGRRPPLSPLLMPGDPTPD